MDKLKSAEHLTKRGWLPNRTTPFPKIAECEDETAGLNEILLAHYTDHWNQVKAELKSAMECWGIDTEAKAVFREALNLHEAGFYRSVSRLLFPEIERIFRTVIFEDTPGNTGKIDYRKIAGILSGLESDVGIDPFLIVGIPDAFLFTYLHAGHQNPSEYEPGLGVSITRRNITNARENPIPTRHAVVHGLVSYPEPQHSLNAIFIADYVFSLIDSLTQPEPHEGK